MNRVERSPLLLTVAGIPQIAAVAAYLIVEAEAKVRRIQEAFERQALDVRSRRSVAELRALRDESEPTCQDRARICDQQAEILKSLGRFEDLLRTALASPGR